MTELQQKSLELLKEFILVCEKLNLRWFAVCGTALGTVKYQGFIPWDNDIDVALPRKDYEIFIRKAPELLPDWVFTQNYLTDPEFPLLMTKLRNRNSTFVENLYKNINMNHGIYIDVFPLDGYPDDPLEAERLEWQKGWFYRRYSVKYSYNRFKSPRSRREIIVWLLYKIFGYCKNTKRVIEKYNKLLSSYPLENSKLWCNHGNWQGKLEYAPREQYGDGIIMKFEGLDLRIPEKYDEYLTQKYGDWRSPPPNEDAPHNIILCDHEKPYTDYIEKRSITGCKIISWRKK